MISTGVVENVLDKLDLVDYDYTVEAQDETGDYLKVFSPELDFTLLKSLLLQNKALSACVTDISGGHITLGMKGDYRGYNFYYGLKLEAGDAFGTRFTAGTKRIDYFNDVGESKPFISFEMMNEYIKLYGTIKD